MTDDAADLRAQIQTAHHAAAEVDGQVKAQALTTVLSNPKRALARATTACLLPGGTDDE